MFGPITYLLFRWRVTQLISEITQHTAIELLHRRTFYRLSDTEFLEDCQKRQLIFRSTWRRQELWMTMPEFQKSLQFKAQTNFVTDMTSLREVWRAFLAPRFLHVNGLTFWSFQTQKTATWLTGSIHPRYVRRQSENQVRYLSHCEPKF